jgi:hypothetical protein
LTPPALKNFAIRALGSHDKLVLVTGILVVLGLFAAGLGIVAGLTPLFVTVAYSSPWRAILGRSLQSRRLGCRRPAPMCASRHAEYPM